MNIGHLKHEAFVNEYKQWGYSARNKLIDEALELLMKVKKKERRENWRKAAHKEYAGTGSIWESIEGEDFENI